MIPDDILRKLKAVVRRIEVAAAFGGISYEDFNQATSIRKLSEISGMSERSLRDYFKQLNGCRIVDYVSYRRAEYAARILRLFPSMSNSETAQALGFTTRTGLHSLMRKNGVSLLSSLKNPSEISAESLTYRIETEPKLHLFFKLDEMEYNECNSPDFEKSSWDEIENYVQNRWSEAKLNCYVGFAIDRYIADNPDEGIFISGILYDDHVTITLPDDLIGEIGYIKIPPRTYAVFTHIGRYESLNQFYRSIIATLNQSKDIEVDTQYPFMEKYLNSPTNTDDNELITEVYVAITSPMKYSA